MHRFVAAGALCGLVALTVVAWLPQRAALEGLRVAHDPALAADHRANLDEQMASLEELGVAELAHFGTPAFGRHHDRVIERWLLKSEHDGGAEFDELVDDLWWPGYRHQAHEIRTEQLDTERVVAEVFFWADVVDAARVGCSRAHGTGPGTGPRSEAQRHVGMYVTQMLPALAAEHRSQLRTVIEGAARSCARTGAPHQSTGRELLRELGPDLLLSALLAASHP